MLLFNLTEQQIKDYVAKFDTMKTISLADTEVVQQLVEFSKAIWEDLNMVHGDSMMIMMERVEDLAKIHCNYKRLDIFDLPEGAFDPMQMVLNSSQGVVYERLLHAIGFEWKKFQVAV